MDDERELSIERAALDQKAIEPIATTGHFGLTAEEIDVEEIEKQATKYMEVEKRLRQIALKVTNRNDWIKQGDKPYLQWSGAARIARALGVSYKDLRFTNVRDKDEIGEYLIVECTGTILWKGSQIEEIGTGSSRDPFFGKRYDKQRKESYFLPLSEIDLTNIKKKAQTNFLNRGLKSMVGLSFTWDEVKKTTGLKTKDVAAVDYKKEKKEEPKKEEPTIGESKYSVAVKNGIWKKLKEMHGESAKVTLRALTIIKDTKGKKVLEDGVDNMSKVTDKAMGQLIDQVNYQYAEFRDKKKLDFPFGENEEEK